MAGDHGHNYRACVDCTIRRCNRLENRRDSRWYLGCPRITALVESEEGWRVLLSAESDHRIYYSDHPCIVLIVSLVGGSGPVSNVKSIEFDSFPNATVGEIIDGSMRNQDWSTETRGGMKYVYVYGSAPSLGYDQIGFEFSYEDRGDYYYVTLTDVYAEGSWWGQLIAYSCFTEFYNNM